MYVGCCEVWYVRCVYVLFFLSIWTQYISFFKCLKLEILSAEYSHKTLVQCIIFLTYCKLFFYFIVFFFINTVTESDITSPKSQKSKTLRRLGSALMHLYSKSNQKRWDIKSYQKQIQTFQCYVEKWALRRGNVALIPAHAWPAREMAKVLNSVCWFSIFIWSFLPRKVHCRRSDVEVILFYYFLTSVQHDCHFLECNPRVSLRRQMESVLSSQTCRWTTSFLFVCFVWWSFF